MLDTISAHFPNGHYKYGYYNSLLVAIGIVVELGKFDRSSLRLGHDAEAPPVEGDLLCVVPGMAV